MIVYQFDVYTPENSAFLSKHPHDIYIQGDGWNLAYDPRTQKTHIRGPKKTPENEKSFKQRANNLMAVYILGYMAAQSEQKGGQQQVKRAGITL